jgi:bifunctional non-homologous end joining protein LigD
MQLYAKAPVRDTSAYAKALAEDFERSHEKLVVSRMTKAVRPGKVFVDWSQNNSAKTTVTVYSLRAKDEPTVSTPVTWAEVEACRKPSDLVFTSDDVLDRVAGGGDLFAPLLQ